MQRIGAVNISIIYIKGYERPWLIKRVDGKYEQHAHMKYHRDAVKVRNCINNKRCCKDKDIYTALKRLLTKKEFMQLARKEKYINVNNGVK